MSSVRDALDALTDLQPDLTVNRYLSAGGQSPLRQRVARVMGELGMRMH